MKKLILFIIIPIFFTTFSGLSSGTGCNRGPVHKVYLSTQNAVEKSQVNAYFKDGKRGIWKNTATHKITEANLDRIYSLLLASQTSGKSVIVKYPDIESCDNIPTEKDESGFSALWLIN